MVLSGSSMLSCQWPVTGSGDTQVSGVLARRFQPTPVTGFLSSGLGSPSGRRWRGEAANPWSVQINPEIRTPTVQRSHMRVNEYLRLVLQEGKSRSYGRSTMKTYLDVPRTQAGEARNLGARFDMSRKQWYVPDGVDLQEFAQWLPKKITKWWAKL